MRNYNLSVIIPHFNIPNLLDKLLSSIPDKKDIQIIVVDDNSTKDVEQLKVVINKYKNRNIELYRNESGENSPGTCRNIGLEHARGNWILFADADDYYLEEMYEQLCPFFNSDYDIVFFKPTSVRLDNGEIGSRHAFFASIVEAYLDNPSRENELKLKVNNLLIVTRMYSKKFLVRKGICFGSGMRAEDVMLLVRSGLEAQKFAVLDKTLYCITQRNDSITTVSNADYFDQHIRRRIEKTGYILRHISENDISLLGLEYVGMKIMWEGMQGRNALNMLKYARLMHKEKIPFVFLKLARFDELFKEMISVVKREWKGIFK